MAVTTHLSISFVQKPTAGCALVACAQLTYSIPPRA